MYNILHVLHVPRPWPMHPHWRDVLWEIPHFPGGALVISDGIIAVGLYMPLVGEKPFFSNIEMPVT